MNNAQAEENDSPLGKYDKWVLRASQVLMILSLAGIIAITSVGSFGAVPLAIALAIAILCIVNNSRSMRKLVEREERSMKNHPTLETVKKALEEKDKSSIDSWFDRLIFLGSQINPRWSDSNIQEMLNNLSEADKKMIVKHLGDLNELYALVSQPEETEEIRNPILHADHQDQKDQEQPLCEYRDIPKIEDVDEKQIKTSLESLLSSEETNATDGDIQKDLKKLVNEISFLSKSTGEDEKVLKIYNRLKKSTQQNNNIEVTEDDILTVASKISIIRKQQILEGKIYELMKHKESITSIENAIKEQNALNAFEDHFIQVLKSKKQG